MKRYVEIISQYNQKHIVNIDKISFVANTHNDEGKEVAIIVFGDTESSITTKDSYDEIKKHFGFNDHDNYRCW